MVRSSRSRSTSTHRPRSSTRQSVPASKRCDLLLRQRLAVERDGHAEIQQPVEAQRGRRRAPDSRR